jgi:hypothetical protein
MPGLVDVQLSLWGGERERPEELAEEFGLGFLGANALGAAELREIWRLAGVVGLIKGDDGERDCAKYRAWLLQRFQVHTTAELSGPDRARAMNELRLMMAAYA